MEEASSSVKDIMEVINDTDSAFSAENKENVKYTSCEQCRSFNTITYLENYECPNCLQNKLMLNNKKSTSFSSLPCQPVTQSQHGEKRKCTSTRYNNFKLPTLSSNLCDSSSDDEIKDLCSKYKCVNSSVMDKSLSNSTLWKNHRRIICIDRVGVPRPSLNFEKMRQVCFHIFLLVIIFKVMLFV